MEQSFLQSQTIKQEQTQVLSQTQILGLNILQESNLDLRARIDQELRTNPALVALDYGSREILVGDPISDQNILLDKATQDEEHFQKREDFSGPNNKKSEHEGEDEAPAHELDLHWDQDPTDPFDQRDLDREKRREYFLTSLNPTTKSSFSELEDEIRELAGDNEAHIKLCPYIIGNINPQTGFLEVTVDELGKITGIDHETIEEFIRTLQWRLEPPGMLAQDIRESLLIQLEREFEKDELPWQIVDTSWDDLLHNRIQAIAKKLDRPVQDINDAKKRIGLLNPRPGSLYDDTPTQYIFPEAEIVKINGQWRVIMLNEAYPSLAINEDYENYLTLPQITKDKEAVKHIKTNIDKGKSLIKAIADRLTTIEKITLCILNRQREFFEYGDEALKPMTQADIADDLGFNKSTISRATQNKHIRTPFGCLPYDHFFSGNLGANNDVAANAVKQKIAELINAESPFAPLSDQKIAEMLKRDNIDIARRTVAKYREELGILPTSRRRQHK